VKPTSTARVLCVPEEAPLEQYDSGLAPASEGWFVVNVGDATWLTHEVFGAASLFESPDAEFAELGVRLTVLEPGQPNGLYHGEETQEAFSFSAASASSSSRGRSDGCGHGTSFTPRPAPSTSSSAPAKRRASS
jgi:hypothetical protein